MDILSIFLQKLLEALGGMPTPINMFLIRLGLWFLLLFIIAWAVFTRAMENRIVEWLAPFLVFGLATPIAFCFPLEWINSGGRVIGLLDLLSVIVIIVLPRVIPRLVFRNYGYQMVVARVIYWAAAILMIVQVAYINGR